MSKLIHDFKLNFNVSKKGKIKHSGYYTLIQYLLVFLIYQMLLFLLYVEIRTFSL